jgi:hypothetical protein
MGRLLGLVFAAALPVLAAAGAQAAAAPSSDYDRDVITVVTLGRHGPFATANCMVWANAEGLGVGPAELGGLHGVTMNINPQPLASENLKPTLFDAGFAEMKGRFPTAPAWLLSVVEKNKAGIVAACLEDHPIPFKVHTITARDKQP